MAFLHKSYLLILACIGLALALADGADPHVDHGTCGNACCKIHFVFATSTKEVLKRMTNALSKNPSYSPQLMNDGSKGVSDYSGFHIGVDFIGKYNHVTSGPRHYNDSIYFLVKPKPAGHSTVEVFSLSLIGGAFGDGEGQNYHNIQGFMTALGDIQKEQNVIFGCGKESLQSQVENFA